VIQATDGNFYGTTAYGGYGYGTVFRLTPDGKLTTLHRFTSYDGADGTYPYGGLIQATDGNFYGTTHYGGLYPYGTIFRITADGTLTTLHNFDNGEEPEMGVMQATDGSLYGTTPYGGVSFGCGSGFGCGTVFGLSVGLSPFVETQPTSGRTGTAVRILGTDLKAATSVTFSGTPAAFKVVSGSLISATVPTGATTGPLQVVTPNGTLTSNVSLRVLP